MDDGSNLHVIAFRTLHMPHAMLMLGEPKLRMVETIR